MRSSSVPSINLSTVSPRSVQNSVAVALPSHVASPPTKDILQLPIAHVGHRSRGGRFKNHYHPLINRWRNHD